MPRARTAAPGAALAGAAALAAVPALPAPARAQSDPCPGSGVPDCQPQQQAAVKYSGWQTQDWAYYCTGDHPVFYRIFFMGTYSFDNSCFTVTENPFFENASNKFDATITNWCFGDQQVVVTLGCSGEPSPNGRARAASR